MNFQGPYHGKKGFSNQHGGMENKMDRLAELNRLTQMSQMNQMQISRLQAEIHQNSYSGSDDGFEDGGYDDYHNGDGYEYSGSDYEGREPMPPGMDNSMDGSGHSHFSSRDRGRDRDRDHRDMRSRDDRDRGRDRDRRRDSDRDRRSGDWSQDRDRGRHRDRSGNRDRSPVDSYRSDGGSSYGSEYDMGDDPDRRGGDDRRGRNRDNRDNRSDERGGEDKWVCTQPSRKLILRGMHTNVDEKMISAELAIAGLPVKDIRLIRRSSGVSRGFAFVEFHNLTDAQRWMDLTQGSLLIQNQYRATLAYSIQRDRGGNRDGNSLQRYDWVCSKCLGHNFKRRDYCFNCNLPRKESEKGKPIDGQDEIGTNPCNTLIFRGLDALTTEEGLVTGLAQSSPHQLAPIKNVAIIRDEMNTSRGFGFVEFHSVQASTQVLDILSRLDMPLEVDGKQLLIDYAKNTFNTTMACIQQQQAAQSQFYDSSYYNQGQYYDPNTQQYYNYSDYYAQAGATPTTTAAAAATTGKPGEHSTNNAAAVAHAAIQQAQAVKNLQKQVQKKTVGGDYVTVNGVDYPVYPPPDTSLYQYEETSGYYYDPTTQLYYDANSQYYYNSTTGQFMYWDADKSTYLPAPTNADGTATVSSPEVQEGGEKKEGGKEKKDKEKSKMAKKIAKDMEKWAKSMNAQKEAQKDVFKKPMGAPMSIALAKQESAAADAGFAMLQKAKDDTPTKPAPPVAESPAASSGEKPGLVASYGGDSDSGDEEDPSTPIDESKLVDWSKLACLLCKRQFQSKDILSKHTQVSQLHKNNLESLRKSREAAAEGKIEYRDRAKERRLKYGAPGPPEPHKRNNRGEGEEVAEPAIIPEAPTKFGIGGDNIGNKLLQKMGWSHGQGLGKSNQGRVDPVEAKRRNQAAGLGARGSNVVAEVGDSYRDALKKTMFARYSELD